MGRAHQEAPVPAFVQDDEGERVSKFSAGALPYHPGAYTADKYAGNRKTERP